MRLQRCTEGVEIVRMLVEKCYCAYVLHSLVVGPGRYSGALKVVTGSAVTHSNTNSACVDVQGTAPCLYHDVLALQLNGMRCRRLTAEWSPEEVNFVLLCLSESS